MSAGQWLGIGILTLLALVLLISLFRGTRSGTVDPRANKGTTTGTDIWYDPGNGGGAD
ncbi:MAG: hypothetical protein AB3N20_16970 [Rhizobiaceae bacterium]